MKSDGIATEAVTALVPILTPHGRLLLELVDVRRRCHPTCHTGCGRRLRVGSGHGILQLGAAEVGTMLTPVFGYWRELGARYVSAMCGQQGPDTSRSQTIIGPPPLGELEKLAAAVPPMVGAEYLTPTRRQQAAHRLAKLRKKGSEVSPVQIEGRKIATTFWGKAWCENLERYSDFENRLPRGRTYMRNRSVIDLQVTAGTVTALVSGSDVYDVRVDVAVVPKARLDQRDLIAKADSGLGRADLSHRTFVFMEACCTDPQCGCRRVMLNVIDAETHNHVATINYAFEPPMPPFEDEGSSAIHSIHRRRCRQRLSS